jgi:hypothetical protein
VCVCECASMRSERQCVCVCVCVCVLVCKHEIRRERVCIGQYGSVRSGESV